MGQELQVPDWATKSKRMASAFAGMNPQEDSLSDGIQQSYGIIGYRGKVWSIRVDGQRRNFVRADDGTPSSYLDVIIVGHGQGKSRSYYPKNTYVEGSMERPLCSSLNGKVPDAGVPQRQHTNCTAECPRAVWPQSGGGPECSEYKRLAVLILPPQTERLFGTALKEPVYLKVPGGSLKNMAKCEKDMTDQGWGWYSYVTRLTFDPEKPHPCIRFQAVHGLDDEQGRAIVGMMKHPLVKRITGDNEVNVITHQDAPNDPPPNGNAHGVEIQPTYTAPVVHNPVGPPITVSPQPPLAVEPQVPLDDAPVAPVSAVADAGAPEESDAAMDALIANLTAQHLNASK